MALKNYNPTTPGQRQLVMVDRSALHKGKLKMFKNRLGQQSDVKRAIVTLEEGHRIDVTTGL